MKQGTIPMSTLKLVLEKQSRREVTAGGTYGPTFTYTLCFNDGIYVDNATTRQIAPQLPAGAHVMDGHLDVHTRTCTQAKVLSSRKLSAAERKIDAEGLNPQPYFPRVAG